MYVLFEKEKNSSKKNENLLKRYNMLESETTRCNYMKKLEILKSQVRSVLVRIKRIKSRT